jgi:hypothetical protein
MALFTQKDYMGVGLQGNVDESQAQADLMIIANHDTDFGWTSTTSPNRSQITYTGATVTSPQQTLAALVTLNPGFDIVIVAAGAGFVLNNGMNTPITALGAVTLPAYTPGNNSPDCLVIYDTTNNNGLNYCGARKKSGAAKSDLRIRTEHYLYNQLDYAHRFVLNSPLASTPGICNPSSAADKSAINAENELRKQICKGLFKTAQLRDPDDACVVNCPKKPKNKCSFSICCIIASVASGSPVSREVSALRAVRDTFVRKTDVGFAFFNKLFYDYYGFSPQICTIMAGRPALAPMVLQGFVRPLIVALRLLQAYALDGLNDARLGRLFVDHHPDRKSAATALTLLNQARAFSQGDVSGADELCQSVARLLRERAWPSAHVRWGLIEPVRIYGEALEAYAAGARSSDVGRLLRRAFIAWAAEMPLDHVWATLTAKQARKELAIYESRLLRSVAARARFRERLADRFGEITAVRAALAGARTMSGSSL